MQAEPDVFGVAADAARKTALDLVGGLRLTAAEGPLIHTSIHRPYAKCTNSTADGTVLVEDPVRVDLKPVSCAIVEIFGPSRPDDLDERHVCRGQGGD